MSALSICIALRAFIVYMFVVCEFGVETFLC